MLVVGLTDWPGSTLPASAQSFGDTVTQRQRDIISGLAGQASSTSSDTFSSRSTPSERSEAAAFLADKITELGLRPVRQKYRVPNVNGIVDLLLSPYEGTNVYAIVAATVQDAPFVVIGAHYDSEQGSPGAIDNASGVALVYALAYTLSKLERRYVNFIVVFFDQEEDDEAGSRAFVRYLASQGHAIHSVHIADMVGWDGDGDRTVEIESPGPELENIYRAAGSDLKIPLVITQGASSDTRSFRAGGIPTVGVWENLNSGDSTPHYHQSSDTFATVNFEYLASTTELMYQVVTAISEDRGGDER